MKRCVFFTALFAIVLIALTACYDVMGISELDELGATCTFSTPAFDDYRYQANAYNEAILAISWQEAYAEKLNYYIQQPTTVADIEVVEW